MVTLENLIAKNGKVDGDLVGIDGNAFSLIAYTSKCLRNGKWSREDIQAFQKIATSGDYHNVICTCASVLNFKDGEDL
jgi:hypothetical protein